jgi:hypothetical protein
VARSVACERHRAKLSRMKELRSARLTITSEIFELDRQDRRAS